MNNPGIDIQEDDANKENIPSDLNSLAYVDYRLPSLKRRRDYFFLLISILILCLILSMYYLWIDFTFTFLILSFITIYLLFTYRESKISQNDVIEIAGKFIEHSIGYYSIGLTFNGIRLKPIWTVIIYDHKEPPTQRTIVEIAANEGHLGEEIFNEKLK